MEHNIKVVESIYEAFNRGDIGFIVERLTDDVTWVSHLDPCVPWGGSYSGKEKVPEFFNAILDSVEVESFEPLEFFAADDTVVSIGTFGCQGLKTGKSTNTRWVFVWRFRDGQVCSYEQFHDPAINAVFE